MKALLIAMVFFAGVAMLHCQIQDGVYQIKSANDQGAWDLCGAPNCSPEEVDLFTYPPYPTGSVFPSQQIAVTSLGNGFYAFSLSNYDLGVVSAQSNNPDATLSISAINLADTNQQFAIVARSDGTYLIKPRDLSNLAMKSPAVGPEYAQIFLDTKSCTALDQRFNFVPINAPSFALRSSKPSQGSEGGING